MAVKVWALVDALTRPAAAYVAAEKPGSRPAADPRAHRRHIAAVARRAWGCSRSSAGAAFVYILDAKPAIAAITRVDAVHLTGTCLRAGT